MANLAIVAQQVAILFALIGCGAALRRLKLLGDDAVGGLVNLLILVVTPCLIVDVFQRPFDPTMLRGLAAAFAAAVLAHLASIALATALLRDRDENVRRPLLLAAVFSNAGFMGIPLEHALLGDGGVFYGAVYVVVFNLFIWSWGVAVMRPRAAGARRRVELKAFVNPGTVGLALGLPLFFFSARLPAVLATPVHELANLNTPLAMIVVGHCLAGADLRPVLRIRGVYVASALRLVAFPLLVIAALLPFRPLLAREMAIAVAIAASAPVAAMVAMFAAKFGRSVDVSAAIMSGTTLLSVLTMPVVIALAMSLF